MQMVQWTQDMNYHSYVEQKIKKYNQFIKFKLI